jgi:hypothetical protein
MATVFDQASLPLSLTRYFSYAQGLQLELGRSSPAPARDRNDAHALNTTCSTPVHATVAKISLTSPPSNHIVARFLDAA